MNQKQFEKKIENEIKAFVYNWYSRFDKGTNIDEIRPFLPDHDIEFIYPTKTLKSVDELIKYAEQTSAYTKSSAHYLNEISVYKISENKYEVICPHTYHTLQADGNMIQMDFIGRMKVEANLKTKKDPGGKLLKVNAYKVVLQNTPTSSSEEHILNTKKMSTFSVNDAQSFVHTWFSIIDAGDAHGLMNLTSNKPLEIDILGNKIADKDALKRFLLEQKESQIYSVHTPTNIKVENNDNDNELKVRFVLNFAGEVKGIGDLNLTNVTTWVLVEEEGQLKLRDYRLDLL